MSEEVIVVKGDTLKVIYFYLKAKNPTTKELEALDLTDCTLQAKYSIAGGAQKTKDLVIVGAPTAGLAKLVSDETTWDAAGTAHGRIYITNASKLGITPLEFEVEVIEP